MDILIFGGSFDPPHISHMRMLKSAIQRLRPKQVYVVPAFHSPLKSGPRANAEQRLKMTEAALRESLSKTMRSRVRVSRFEIDRGRMTYTYETLRFFARKHPKAQLHFLLGSDTALQFEKWKRVGDIRDVCRFVIGRRPRIPLKKTGLRLPAYTILPGVFPDISSTEVRARLLIGKDMSSWIPRSIERLIRTKKLYGATTLKKIKNSLDEHRFKHTQSVADMAIELAICHGIDVERAALAGLLHDCGRSISVNSMSDYIRKNRVAVPLSSQITRKQPMLFHAHISEDIARRIYKITDAEILSAIRKHTLGDLYMSPLDLLIYTADACSRDRRFPEAARIRSIALKDLSRGFKEAVRTKLIYVLRLDGWLHSSGISLWNKLVEK